MAQTNESQEQVTVNVETLQPVTRTLMTIGALPTSYLISMTYEEQLLWLQNYLIKTVIPAINNNAEATQEVQDIVMALQDYINTQFSELNLQEYIDNKLDEMLESGVFENILMDYVQLTKVYDTYNDMIFDTSTFVNGMKLKTLGYHSINDGGGADYVVTNVQNDNKYQVNIGTNLWIEMIITDKILPEQFGAYGNDTNDDTQAIQNCLNFGLSKGVNIEFSKKYIVNPSNMTDGSKVCLLINSRRDHLYDSNIEITFVNGARIKTNSQEECSLIRINAGNIKFNNMYLFGVLGKTKLIEMSRINQLDTTETQRNSFNKFSNLKLINCLVAIEMSGSCYYNTFETGNIREATYGIKIKMERLEEEGVQQCSACNRNNFLNYHILGYKENGIRIEYGDTNKFVNVSFEIGKNAIYVDSPYLHKTDFPIEPQWYVADNMFVNITEEANTGYSFYNNCPGTKVENISSKFVRSNWPVLPQVYIGGVDTDNTTERFGQMFKVLDSENEKPFANALSNTTLINSRGTMVRSVADYYLSQGACVNLNRQRFGFELPSNSNINEETGITYDDMYVKSIGNIIFVSGKFRCTPVNVNASIKLNFNRAWMINATGNFANIQEMTIPIIMAKDGTTYPTKMKILEHGIQIFPPENGFFNGPYNDFFLNFHMFRDRTYDYV